MVRSIQILELFDKNGYKFGHSIDPVLEEVSLAEQFFDAKLLI